jgi:hypothetical protein
MLRKTLWIAAVAMLFVSRGYAQGISGDWQGTLTNDSRSLRLILHIVRHDDTWALHDAEARRSGPWNPRLSKFRLDATCRLHIQD